MFNNSTFNSLELQRFFPDDLRIQNIDENGDGIIIKMHSVSKTCTCPKCGATLNIHHGSHHRSAQDLPILGKAVHLEMQIFDYQCTNKECNSFAPTETFDGFINYNSRMTNRLEEFICALALETSCEATARIMNSIHVKISGNTVIRLLVKRFSSQPATQCGSTIGVDDFAFKKRQKYGAIIVDEATHQPVAVLDGRDGETLKEWLKQNKHVTTVTRDRASAYAKAIEEVLPECMQIADRFHLHQNLMDAVQKVLRQKIPSVTTIEENASTQKAEPEEEILTSEADNDSPSKKNGRYKSAL